MGCFTKRISQDIKRQSRGNPSEQSNKERKSSREASTGIYA